MPESRRKSKPNPAGVVGEPDARLRQACADLNIPLDQALAWKIYPDRIVILFKDGQKLSRAVQS